MIPRMTALTVLVFGIFALMKAAAVPRKADAKPTANAQAEAKAKKALQEVQDFIGLWNLEGTQKIGGKTEAWKEKLNWSWKFKDGDVWLVADFAEGKGKFFTAGVLKYDVEKKTYLFTLTGTDKTEQAFEGNLVRGDLKLERRDAKTGDVYRLTMNTLAEGVRFQLKYEKQEGGKGLFANVFALNGNKDGESIAGAAKKPECIVSGGAATIAVSYKGNRYYVCCGGCRDEFNANPEKYVRAKK